MRSKTSQTVMVVQFLILSQMPLGIEHRVSARRGLDLISEKLEIECRSLFQVCGQC
jgi:hypothetical protein